MRHSQKKKQAKKYFVIFRLGDMPALFKNPMSSSENPIFLTNKKYRSSSFLILSCLKKYDRRFNFVPILTQTRVNKIISKFKVS